MPKKSSKEAAKTFILKIPVPLHYKLRVLAAAEEETLHNLLLKASEVYLKGKAPWIEEMSTRRMARVGLEDKPILLEAITKGTGDKLYRTKSGKLRLRDTASKRQKKAVRRS